MSSVSHLTVDHTIHGPSPKWTHWGSAVLDLAYI
jgi:hypothetical protein